MRHLSSIALFTCLLHSLVGQVLTDDMQDREDEFNASTKQVNQFFRRFNGEESEKGERYYASDKNYRSPILRKKFLPTLFDQENGQLSKETASKFISTLTDKQSPLFLDFHSDEWYAEVQTVFTEGGQEVSGLLYMQLQKQGQGYEWVIRDVSFDRYASTFKKDTSEGKKFIHPMSHELDFMTLKKAFMNEHTEQFTARDFAYDQLSIFLYERNAGKLQFKTVKNVRFHFFSIQGWYFSTSYYNRSGYNTGWLIENLVWLQNDDQKQQIMRYVFDKN